MLASAALIIALQATPTPIPSPSGTPAAAQPVPSPLPTDNPTVAKLARDQFYAFASGRIDSSLYSIEIPKDALPQVQAFLTELGPIESLQLVQSTKTGESTVYVYQFNCQNGGALEQISLRNGKIDGIFFRPVQN